MDSKDSKDKDLSLINVPWYQCLAYHQLANYRI